MKRDTATLRRNKRKCKQFMIRPWRVIMNGFEIILLNETAIYIFFIRDCCQLGEKKTGKVLELFANHSEMKFKVENSQIDRFVS